MYRVGVKIALGFLGKVHVRFRVRVRDNVGSKVEVTNSVIVGNLRVKLDSCSCQQYTWLLGVVI